MEFCPCAFSAAEIQLTAEQILNRIYEWRHFASRTLRLISISIT